MPDPSLLLMWTALPRGIDTTTTPAQARLAVLLSPRVSLASPSVPATVADVADLADWPSRIGGLRFSVEVDDGTGTGSASVAATVVPATLDSALWQALLPGSTPVQGRVFDQDGIRSRPMQSYGHATAVDGLKSGYSRVFSSSPVALPGHPGLAQAFPALAGGPGPATPLLTRSQVATLGADDAHAQRAAVASELVAHARAGTLPDAVRHAADLAAHLARLTGGGAGLLFPGTGTEAGELGRVLAFHTVPLPAAPSTPSAASGGFEPELHSIITLLHEHPALLSRLGLLIELTVPAGALPQAGLGSASPARLRVTVVPGSGSLQSSTTHYSPWTAFVRDADQVFTPRPATPEAPETVAGLLNLALPGVYTLGQIDADGSVLKAFNMMAMPAGPDDQDGGLPAVRTTGPSLVRAGQADALVQRMDQAAQNEDGAFGASPAPVTLLAEDLTRGYRIDVRDHADGVWRSLHERDVTYTVPGLPDLTVRDEGVAQPAGALDSADPQQATTLLVHESLARWEGWSLSVPRPGQVAGDTGAVSRPSAPAPGGVPLTSASSVVAASLPRLRFGHTYDVRARVTDLGGGGLDQAGADAALALLAELEQPPPVLPAPGTAFTFQRFEPVPSPVLVAREQASEGESAQRLVIRSSRTQPAGQLAAQLNDLAAAASPDTGVRYLGVCERHLVPPKATQQTAERAGMLDALTAAAAYLVSSKDQGGLADDAVLDIGSGQLVALDEADDPFTGGTRPAVELITISDGSAYPVHHEAALLLPYLPDWLATGAVLCDLPGAPAGQQAVVNAAGTLVITAPVPTLDDSAGVRSVTTIPFTGTWPLLAPLRLQLAPGDGPPAWDPAERVLTVQLPAGRTATIRLSSALPDGALELLGQWHWLLAAQAAPDAALAGLAQHGLTWPLTPFREVTLVHASQQPVLDPVITTLTATRTPAATGAALSGLISLDASSTSQLELIASWTDPPAPGQPANPSSAHVLATPVPPGPGLGQLDPGANGSPDVLALSGPEAHHEFGDTKHRQVTYQAVASTAFTEYFPAGAGPGTASSATVTIDIPSSAAPPAPRIREAVPMWRWDRPADASLPRRRYGAGVRLILEPDWFASGAGEQLAVVLLEPASYPPGPQLRARVTHWGADPTFSAPPLPGAPQPASFPAAGPTVTVDLDDDGPPVLLLPHAVTYDRERNVYVCDIPVDPGPAYMPFVRLAVVRYQPDSLPGLARSAVAQAPFVQVLPERRVTLTPPAPGAPDTLTLRVDGNSYTQSSVVPGMDLSGDEYFNVRGVLATPDLITVTVQERVAGTSDEAGWAQDRVVRPSSAVSGRGLSDAPPGSPLWTGQINLPPGRSPGQFRILVTEYELLDSDFPQQKYSYQMYPDPTDPRLPTSGSGFYRPGSRRLVFAEEIVI